MLEPGTHLFVGIPAGTGERMLHPATTVTATGATGVVELKERELHFELGTVLPLFREITRRFMQQPARVRAVEVGDGRTVIDLEILGEPVLADSRECFRVSAVGAEIRAQFGPEADCPVLDVSATGFSVCASKSHAIGTRVEVVMHFEGTDRRGAVVVQSVRAFDQERWRYGVLCLDDARPGQGLQAALPGINLAIQRQQLQRLAGYR